MTRFVYLFLILAISVLLNACSSQSGAFIKNKLGSNLLVDTLTYQKFLNVDNITSRKLNVDSLLREFPEESGIVLKSVMYGVQETDGDEPIFSYVRKIKYIVFDPNADELLNVNVSYRQFISLVNFNLIVVNPDESKAQYGLEDLVKSVNNEYWTTYRLPIKNVQKGCIVEITYTTSTENAVAIAEHDPSYLRHTLPCLETEFVLEYPAKEGSIILKKIADSTGVSVVNVPKSGVTKVRLGKSDAVKYEPFSLPRAARYSRIDFLYKKNLGAAYRSNNYWDEYRSDMYGYYFQVDENEEIKTESFNKLVDSVLRSASNTPDSIQAIKSWLTGNVKIDNSLKKPQTGKQVFTSKRGSIFATALLAKQMYTKAGFDVQIVELHSAENGDFERSFTSAGQFGELSLIVQRDSAQYLVLISRKLQPVTVVPDEYVGQPYIIVSETASYPDIVEGKMFWQDTSNRKSDLGIEITEEGDVNVNLTLTLTGESAYEERVELDKLPKQEQETYVRRWLVMTQAETQRVGITIQNIDKPNSPLIFSATYSIPGGVIITPTEAILQTGGFLSRVTNSETTDTNTRTSPIKIWNPYKYSRNIEIKYPKAWKLQLPISLAQNRNQSTLLGTTSKTVKTSAGSLSLQYVSNLNSGTFPKENYRDLYEIIGNSGASSVPNLVFTLP